MSEKSNLSRTFRSAYRTVSRKLGRGPPKIMNSNVGDNTSQCHKFMRFEELYKEYVGEKNEQIAMALVRIRKNQAFYFKILSNVLLNTLEPEPQISMIDKLISDIEFRSLSDLTYIKDIPDEPDYYNVLKEELRFFVIFLRKYVIDKLKKYKETGDRMNIDAFLSCTPVNYNAPYVWIRNPFGSPKGRRKTRKGRSLCNGGGRSLWNGKGSSDPNQGKGRSGLKRT